MVSSLVHDTDLKRIEDTLNSIDGVSVEECFTSNKYQMVRITLIYGDSEKYIIDNFNKETLYGLMKFTCKLVSILANMTEQHTGILSDIAYDIEVSLNWAGEKKLPTALITFPSYSIKAVAELLACVKMQFENHKQNILPH